MAKKPTADKAYKTVCRNRKASHRFSILEQIECGMVLCGTEVKSLRAGTASVAEAYALIAGRELWLIGSHIPTYKFGHAQNHEPLRKRKLLVRARDIRKLHIKVQQKGLTLVPLRIYFNERGLAKLTLGVAVGKKLGDKREALKAGDHRREMDRAMHGRR